MSQPLTHETSAPPRLLQRLRSISPHRALQRSEALNVAELQALRFLELTGHTHSAPVPTHAIAGLPRIQVIDDASLPISGLSHWNPSAGSWFIRLNPTHSGPQRRFTLAHEFKHILDFGSPGLFSPGAHAHCTDRFAETVADVFAMAVLLPKAAVRRHFAAGARTPLLIAAHFDVPVSAARSRLIQLGLLVPRTSPTPARRQEATP